MLAGVDHEYIPENAAKGDMPSERPDVHKVYCEIMQLGACKVDADGREVGVLNRTVQAHLIHVIPPWLSRMTGMTAEKREAEGVPFPQALDELVEFARGAEGPYTFNGDYWVVKANVEAHGLCMPFQREFFRVKPRLAQWGITLADYQRLGFSEVNSGNLHKVLGITLPEIVGVGAHDAAHDARSLTHSLYHLLRRS
jgi:hypothetical protein